MTTRRKGSVKLLAALLGLTMVAAACGSDADDGSGGTATPEGGETEGTSEAPSSDSDVSDAETITFAGEQEPTGLNWLQAEDNAAWTQYVMNLVWPNLYISDPGNEFIANEDIGTAELTSEDPQVVTIDINEEATWSDGEPVDAEDFIFTAEIQADCSGEGENAVLCASDNGYKDIESIEAGDSDRQVVVTFATPYADWQGLFQPVFPQHAFEAAGDGDVVAGFNEGFKVENVEGNLDLVPSAGPYVVSDLVIGSQMTLTRNPEYWGDAAVTETIVVPWITDATQQPAAFENGEADGGFPQVQLDLFQQLDALSGFTTEIGFGTFFEHIDMNSANPNLADVEVRQALALAIDRDAIVETVLVPFSSEAEVLNNRIFFPSDERYVDNAGDFATRDVDEARTLLESVGYTEGAGGIMERDGQPLEIGISWRDPNPRREQIATLIQAQALEAGFQITLEPKPDFTFLDNLDFDIALFGWTGGTVLSSSESIYVEGGGQNYTGLGDPRIQELYGEANIELDDDARAELMNEIDTVLWEQMATIPIAQNPEAMVSSDTLGNLVYNGFQGPMWNSATWGAL